MTVRHWSPTQPYLRLLKRLERDHEAGVPYLLTDLPEDYPAIQFARKMNPGYGK